MRFLACFLFSVSMLLSGIAYAQQTAPQAPITDPFPGSHPLNDPQLSTFRELVRGTGVYDLFQGTGPFTAFAPNNAAFAKVDPKTLEALKKNKDQLTTILLYHVVPGKYLSKYIKTETVRTLNGNTLNLLKEGDTITVNKAKVIKADLEGPNGVVHIVDTVLIP
jgi:uncharacterized surface protein with fasciclin (FAS1) repeats